MDATTAGLAIGVLSVFINYLQYRRDKMTQRVLIAAKGTIEEINDACNETLADQETIQDVVAVRQFIKRINSLALGAKKTIDTSLTTSWWQRLLVWRRK